MALVGNSSVTLHRLDTLPTEIIRRVASNGPCSSALALLRTNRTLRAAVNDWTVFQAIISNNGNRSQASWDIAALPKRSDIDFWARYALADLKSVELSNTPEKVKPNQLSQWAPQLVVMRHPFLSYTQLKHFPNYIQQTSPHDELAISFCRAACAMSHQFDLFPGAIIPETARMDFYTDLLGQSLENNESFDPLRTFFEADTFPWITNSANWPRFHDPCSSPTQLLTLAYKALPMIRYELLRAIAEDKVYKQRYQAGFIPPLPPPNPYPPASTQVPLSTLMTLPLPFWPNCAEDFDACHVPAMCTASFIKTGSWIGYHLMTNNSGQEPAHISIPMDGLQFFTIPSHEETDTIELRSNGGFCDIMDMFSLGLTLRNGAAKLELTKLYSNVGQIDLPFQAIMTPFGIVATFGDGTPWEFGATHWMWLWKSEWSTEAELI